MPLDIRMCACGKRFRPQHIAQRRCRVCISEFACSDVGDGALAQLRTPGRINVWPVPQGICAYSKCSKAFDAYPNQRYCSSACRFQAMAERQRIRLREVFS